MDFYLVKMEKELSFKMYLIPLLSVSKIRFLNLFSSISHESSYVPFQLTLVLFQEMF